MSGRELVKARHLERGALVYVRQSSPKQVEANRESGERQYALRRRAEELGWRPEQVRTVDEDQGRTGSGECERTGYDHLVYEVARGRVGAVLGLEVSRFARDAADFYRLLQWCRSTDTLVVEDTHVFSPKHHDDRFVLGIKGTMSERELFTNRDRMLKAARNKAARGELYHRVPIGYVREGKGLVKDPHEGVRHAIEAVFARFREQGTARQAAAALRDAGVKLPGRRHAGAEAEWSEASYSRVLQILTNPMLAGVYVYGRHRVETVLNASGQRKRRVRHVPMDEWRVLIEDHHEGYLSWGEWLEIRQQLAGNRQRRGGPGAVREGRALLQGVAVCGHCGRAMTVHYRQAPVYVCRTAAVAGNARRVCQSLGGKRVDELVAREFLEVITPAGVAAALRVERDQESRRKAALRSHELELQRCEYNQSRAERHLWKVEPENDLVARTVRKRLQQAERELEQARQSLERARARLNRPREPADPRRLAALGTRLEAVWNAPSTQPRDRKRLLRTVLEEVVLRKDAGSGRIEVLLRWRGGQVDERELPALHPPVPVRDDEETTELVRRLARWYPDETIAATLGWQGRRTARGLPFTKGRVRDLRQRHGIAAWKPGPEDPDAPVVTLARAARQLRTSVGTLYRWIRRGVVASEQPTPGAPHRIRLTPELLARFRNTVEEGFVPVEKAIKVLGVSRQTVWNRIKAGQLARQHVVRGPEKGLYVKLSEPELPLLGGLEGCAEVAPRKAGAADEEGGSSAARGRRQAGERA